MADGWDAEKYRQRAEEWQKKAESLGEGKERTACLIIAEGYARLAELIGEPVATVLGTASERGAGYESEPG